LEHGKLLVEFHVAEPKWRKAREREEARKCGRAVISVATRDILQLPLISQVYSQAIKSEAA